ncbi:MAG: hypothetical protein ACKO0Z_09215 [Betaproteobacteria bacterium]
MDYDPADNSRKCHALAIKETRLNNIRRGKYHPRPHVKEEVAAWKEGVRGRRIITGSLTAAFLVVAGVMYLGQETPPVATSVAAIEGAE